MNTHKDVSAHKVIAGLGFTLPSIQRPQKNAIQSSSCDQISHILGGPGTVDNAGQGTNAAGGLEVALVWVLHCLQVVMRPSAHDWPLCRQVCVILFNPRTVARHTSVDFPAPEGPMTATILLALQTPVTPLRMGRPPSPLWGTWKLRF